MKGIFHFSKNHSKQLTLCHYLLYRSGLSHDVVLPGTIDNSVLSLILSLIISVLSFKGIHNGICNLKFFSMYKPIARVDVDVDDIAFSGSLFSDKVDNTDGLNQLQMDEFGCMVQG